MKSILPWLAGIVMVTAAAVGFGFGAIDSATLVYTMVLTGGIAILAFKAPTDFDRAWLPGLILSAYVVKLAGSIGRFYVLVETYSGVGDALVYYRRGATFAGDWRAFQIPELQVGGSGTTFLSKTAALLFAPYVPSELGAFFLFATLAFVGQVLFYLAFRKVMPQARHKLYAIGVLFLPSLVFWPSSIGKESFVLFLLGFVAWATAHLLGRYRIRWVFVAGLALFIIAAIRPHMAALYGGSIALALLVGRSPGVKAAQTRRWILMAAAGIGVLALATFASTSLDVDLSGDDLDPFLAELQRTTQQGGSAVEGQAVRSVRDIPPAIVRTLYRPLINEGVNLQSRLASIEGTLLLIVSIIRVPAMIRDVRRWRRYPYLVFSFIAVLGYVVGFSAVFNLGILARQRIQVYPLLLVLLIGLGELAAARDKGAVERRDRSERLVTS